MKTNRIARTMLATLCLGLVLAACHTGPSPEELTQVAQAGETELAAAQQTADAAQETADAAEKARVETGVAQTLTAQPTSTSTDTPEPTFTSTPTETPLPSDTPTPEATATETQPPGPTSPPITATRPAPASVYGSTGGPEGFFTTITCSRGGGNCTPTMPPGDISFSFTLGSLATAPWTLFVPYGLSVERDGANVSDMYMTVDAGWLVPGGLVG